MKILMKFAMVAIVVLISTLGVAQDAVILDATDTTSQWYVSSDKDAMSKLDIVFTDQNKGIRLGYTMNNSNWIALVKDDNFSIDKDAALEFRYETTGAILNFSVQLVDKNGNKYGFDFPAGSAPQSWNTVVIPRNSMSYFGGGDGNFDWSAVSRMVFILDAGPSAGEYIVDKSKPGNLSISMIQLVKNTTLNVPGKLIAKTKGEKIKSGGFLIDAMGKATRWGVGSDKDGLVSLSVQKVPAEKGASRNVLKVDYNFGKEGGWVAIYRKIRLDLSYMKQLEFSYKGMGGANNLVVKLIDNTNRVYGFTVDGTTAQQQWQKITVPSRKLQYLYGGGGEAPIALDEINQVQFVIERRAEAKPEGFILLSGLSYE